MTRATVWMWARRRPSSSATVERLIETCGIGAAPPAALASMSGSCSPGIGFGLSRSCSGILLMVLANCEIQPMLLWLCGHGRYHLVTCAAADPGDRFRRPQHGPG